METCKIKNLYNLKETIAKDLFEGAVYPWEVLPKISDFIKKLGATLSEEEYEKRGEDIWIAKSATVAPTAYIHGPAIIGKEAEVRHCAFIRGNAIVGEGAVVGNSTELKNVVLFNKWDPHRSGRFFLQAALLLLFCLPQRHSQKDKAASQNRYSALRSYYS